MSLGHISCDCVGQAVIWSRANQENGNSQFATVSKVWGLMVRELYLRKRWLIQLSMGAKATKNRERSKELEYATFFFSNGSYTLEKRREPVAQWKVLFIATSIVRSSHVTKKMEKKKKKEEKCMLEMMGEKYLREKIVCLRWWKRNIWGKFFSYQFWWF